MVQGSNNAEPLTLACPECSTRLQVVAERSEGPAPFQLFVCCISCGAQVQFTRRVGRVRSVSLAE